MSATLTVPRCSTCARRFKTAQGLSSHRRAFHYLDDACPLCEGGQGQACWWHFL